MPLAATKTGSHKATKITKKNYGQQKGRPFWSSWFSHVFSLIETVAREVNIVAVETLSGVDFQAK